MKRRELPSVPNTEWISVGPNVRVSADAPDWEHTEYMADADPTRPGGLLVCSMMFSPARNQLASVVYTSADGGLHWRTGLRDTTARFGGVWDPACAYGADGSAYFLTLVSSDSVPPSIDASATYETWPELQHRRMPVYQSTNGGLSWSLLTRLGFVDNEDLTVDRTTGRFAGRMYLYGNNNRAEVRRLWILYSADGGTTFSRSAPTTLRDTSYSSVLHAGPGVVTALGALALPYYLERRGVSYMERSLTLAAARSTDGGESISQPAPVAVVPYCMRTSQTTEGVTYSTVGNTTPMMAADHSSGPFRGRTYVVWGQMVRGHCAIMSAYSDDDGSTWSTAAKVSDERPRVAPAQGPDAFLPTIAVNNAGVVGVTWYDRREDSANRHDRLRFSASLDGGESWSSSVAVSRQANVAARRPQYPASARASGGGSRRSGRRTDTFNTTVRPGPRLHAGWNDVHGDYAAIAVSSDGRFCAFWIDNRTGVAQLYTAAVTVSAQPQARGAAALSSLSNVTRLLELQYTSSVYDAASKTLSLEYRLLNTSPDTIARPVRIRITGLDSDLGAPVLDSGAASTALLGAGVVDARNQRHGDNATGILDLSDAIPVAGLAPGMVTVPRSLRIRFPRLDDIIGSDRWNDILRFDATVYGGWRRGKRAASDSGSSRLP